jgi:EAL domain-containing protein (putative c-di-GMP-specific phosphodiesterase class I)
MSRETRTLFKALQARGCTELQGFYASTILACNGLDAALKYVAELPDGLLPLEAAEELYHQELQEARPCH